MGARATGLLALVAILVKRPSDTHRAILCVVLAEGLSVAASFAPHVLEWGLPRLRLSRKTSLVLATRGLIAGLARFGRVTLYGADLLILGSWGSSELGAFAAGRRVVYALAALGLVVPSVLGPAFSRAWVHGTAPARLLLGKALGALIAVAMPASLGLVLVADRAMPALFGGDYIHEGSWLALHAARLPCLLAVSFIQSALVAFGRERWTLRLVLSSMGLAAVLYPVSLAVSGARGVACAALLIEVVSAIGGWLMLGRLGVAPGRELLVGRTLAASLGLVVACCCTRSRPIVLECLAGAIAYISVWFLVRSVRAFDGAST
jgi:O-antigen/teichoic acid export membrane protein